MRYLLIVLILTSCGPAYHLKRAEKHVKKAIEKGAKVGADTTYTFRELKIPGIKVQFEPKPITHNDTVYFAKNKVVTKVLLKHDSIFVETQCPDTVIQVKEKTVTKTVTAVQKSWLKWWYLLIALAVGLVLGVFKR